MHDPNRIDGVLELLRAAWKRHPDLRLGQLIANCGDASDTIYSMEDDELIARVRLLYMPPKRTEATR